ncbi:MAG: bifunctional phosphoribosylaminoimidazolecarboxamide formyltransferase/inosine monophosphate cyclohydrolase [Aciduliprofundum sp.]|nr:MAG: bifunctional phosphoribosylaminoimidazolecarboxamide formyltransferase/inosine monophosphate cyclohydrolase [Aciduliprofundum sp.]
MRVLLSVSDRTGIEDFSRNILDIGGEIYATSGTRNFLISKGIDVRPVEELTNFPEILGGRVKTLHPAVFGGILARKDQLGEIEKLGIKSIDIVVVNLYPFERTEMIESRLIENIDIGGVALIRAAAKNFERVTILVDPSDYSWVLNELREKGEIDIEKRRDLAIKAFYHTSRYDSIIMGTLWNLYHQDIPPYISIAGAEALKLRYGENPHQEAKYYSTGGLPWEILGGKEISYNNILDMESAWKIVKEFEEPAVAIIKHNNPCGVAVGKDAMEAYLKAYDSDSMSAYGGIIGLNRPVDIEFAERLRGIFYEVIVAPDFSHEALEFFSSHKKDLRIVKFKGDTGDLEVRSSAGGILVQRLRNVDLNIKYVTQKKPNDEQMRDLLFAWKVVKHVKSNAIVLAKGGMTVGIGAGQMSRVDAVKVAVMKSGDRSRGSVLASDAFFPFPDDIEEAAKAGVEAIIQPGGSKRDGEVIDAAEKHGIAMVFTGVRVFRH